MVQDKDEMQFLQRENTHASKARAHKVNRSILKSVQKAPAKSLSLVYRTASDRTEETPQDRPAGSCVVLIFCK